MGTFAIAVQVLLAVVFAAAGIGKLLDRPGSRRALIDFGVAPRLAPSLSVLLPMAELATALALVLRPSGRWGGLSALLLLLAFMAGITHALFQGQAPDCHCFGQLHSAPAGRGTLIRNGVLAALALVLVVQGPGPALDGWVRARSATELAAVGVGIVAVLLASTSVTLWLQQRDLNRDLDRMRRAAALIPAGLPIGTPAPEFQLRDLQGNPVTLAELRSRGLPVLLTFVHPTCGPCAVMLPELSRWQSTLAERLTLAVISSGGARRNRPLVEEHGLADVLLQDGDEVTAAYRIRGTPSAVLVAASGEIGSAAAESDVAIEPLIRLALREVPGRRDNELVVIPPRERQLQPSA